MAAQGAVCGVDGEGPCESPSNAAQHVVTWAKPLVGTFDARTVLYLLSAVVGAESPCGRAEVHVRERCNIPRVAEKSFLKRRPFNWPDCLKVIAS